MESEPKPVDANGTPVEGGIVVPDEIAADVERIYRDGVVYRIVKLWHGGSRVEEV
jgi:hypothetical protein